MSSLFRSCSSVPIRRAFSALPVRVSDAVEPLNDRPTVDILEERGQDQLLSIRWNNTSPTSLVPAPWLWVQSAKHIQPGSGQKLETSLSFYGRQARIVDAVWEPRVSHHSQEESFSTPPPLGSLHPMAGMYEGIEAKDDSATYDGEGTPDLSDWRLRVGWEVSQKDRGSKRQSWSVYHGSWLERMLCAASSSSKPPQLAPIAPLATALTARSQLDRVPFTGVIQGDDNDTSLYRTLHAIFQRGAVLVTQTDPPNEDVEDNSSSVARLGRRLSGGGLSHGYLYDPVFHVRTVPNANNIAYTPVALSPHQDLAYYESPPGLQLLHCVKNDTGDRISGASTLLDGIQAADTFRSLAPDLFDVLTQVPATFMKQREEADMMYRRPHIRLGGGDGTTIVSVSWSPPFEGPLVLEQMGEVASTTMMRDYYTAYAAFTRLVDASQPRHEQLLPQLSSGLEQQLCDYSHSMTWECVLEPGTTLVFNNLRMLHGRTALQSGASTRHLMGCYTNIDESLSQYRRLRRLRQTQGAAIPIVGNGSDVLVL